MFTNHLQTATTETSIISITTPRTHFILVFINTQTPPIPSYLIMMLGCPAECNINIQPLYSLIHFDHLKE